MPALNPSFQVVNAAGVAQAVVNQWQGLAAYAIGLWSDVLAGSANVVVRLEILQTTPSGRAQGGQGGVIAVGGLNGTAYEGTVAWELRHSANSNGNGADIVISVAEDYLLNELWLDSTPGTANDIPSNRTDALSVLLHEIGHALGFIGYYQESANSFTSGFHSPYDWRIGLTGGEVYFDGPNTRAVYGGAVPLTDNNYAHYGNSGAFPGADPLTGLMNGVVFYRGHRYTIGDLELAVLADLGLGTIRNDTFDQTWLDVIRGGAGLDKFVGNYSARTDALTIDASGAVWQLPGLQLYEIERLNLVLGSGADSFVGSSASDVVRGAAGDDTLSGAGGNDTLSGGGGADTLNGGAGADTMRGGNGNDTYIVERAGDLTIEGSAAGGSDLVQSSVTRTLGANLEKLTLTGSAAINGTGNTLANIINGNSLANTLSGLGGADTLIGGAGGDRLIGAAGLDILTGNSGADKFVFNSAPAAADRDAITDYNVAADTIQIDDTAFAGIGGPGLLAAGKFHIGGAAADASDRIIYNSATGALYFDADGLGGAAQIQFATLSAGLALTAADFVVI